MLYGNNFGTFSSKTLFDLRTHTHTSFLTLSLTLSVSNLFHVLTSVIHSYDRGIIGIEHYLSRVLSSTAYMYMLDTFMDFYIRPFFLSLSLTRSRLPALTYITPQYKKKRKEKKNYYQTMEENKKKERNQIIINRKSKHNTHNHFGMLCNAKGKKEKKEERKKKWRRRGWRENLCFLRFET